MAFGVGNDQPNGKKGAQSQMLLILAVACGFGLAVSLIVHPRPLLVWNASPSSPIGLYLVTGIRHIHSGELVIAWPPPEARRLAARRRYLPQNVPLVKAVAATNGDLVCAIGSLIIINGHPALTRRVSDPSGRRLPWWQGCHQLRKGELFLLSSNSPLAFDGRYFGVTRSNEVSGGAQLLWRY